MSDVQLLTPPGRSAVATIAIRGEHALQSLASHFRRANGRSLEPLPLHAIVYGTWGAGKDTEDNQQHGEGVVVARIQSDCVEVHCHGGNVAAERILRDLLKSGCRDIQKEEADESASPVAITTEDEARQLLSQSLTERTALILLDQYNGAIRDTIRDTVACIDNRQQERAVETTRALLATYRAGRHLAQPWQVVLSGPANVGKSSLINALVGYQRAIVFNQPGTTRDVITAITAIDGWPVELADTAGIRPAEATESDIESDGIHRAQDRFQNADVAVLVMDAGSIHKGQIPPEAEQLGRMRPDAIRVLNKCDLVPELDQNVLANHQPAVITSATEPIGIDGLLDTIRDAIESNGGKPSPAGTPMLFTERQRQWVQSALLSLEASDFDQAKHQLLQL